MTKVEQFDDDVKPSVSHTSNIEIIPSNSSATSDEKTKARVHAHRLDDLANKYVSEVAQPLDAETDKKLRKKADLYLMPILCLVYCIQFMDKISNTIGSLLGLRESLGMIGNNRYPWVGSGFYLGYLVFEIPLSFVLQKFPLSRATAVIIVAWGITIAASAACKTFETYMVTRVILGALEGAITPSFMVLTSQWYKRSEQYTRTCMWYGSVSIGTFLASMMGLGLYRQQMSSGLPLAGWRLILIIMGVITIVLGFVYYFLVPDTPSEAWFLNAEERTQQVERIRENKQGYGSRHIKGYQIWEALIDPRVWLYFLISFTINVSNGAVTNFQALLIYSLGYSTEDSMIMNLPSAFCGWAGCWLTGIVAMYFFNKWRMFYSIAGLALNSMSMCLLAWGPNGHAKLAGLSMFSWFSPIGFIGLLTSVSSNVAGHTKKMITGAILLIGYCAGNLVGPQVFFAREEPSYPTARIVMAACAIASLGLLVLLEVYNYLENKRRDAKNKKLPSDLVNSEFADLTDRENPEFRYTL